MRAGLLILLAAAPAFAAAPAGQPSPRALATAAGTRPLSRREELELAERAFKDGLYNLVALRMKRLVDSGDAPFPGKDRAELLLAASQYLGGERKAAEERLRKFGILYPTSEYADECQMWIGRLETEYRKQHKRAEKRLRTLYARLEKEGTEKLPVLENCRYYLAMALVEQGGTLQLNGYMEPIPGEPGKARKIYGALDFLDVHIKRTKKILLAEAHILRGRALYFQGEPDKCHDLLQKQFLENREYASHPLRAEAYFWQAEARYGQGHWMKAADLFDRSAKAAGRLGNRQGLAARARYNQGWALLKRAGDLHRAGLAGERKLLELSLRSFEQVMKASEQDLRAAAVLRSGEVLHHLGRALRRAGDAGKARERFQQAWKRLEPLYDAKLPDRTRAPEALYISALALAGMKKHEEAGRLLDLAEVAAAKAKAGGTLAARIDFARGENYFRMAGKLGDQDAGRRKRLLSLAAGAFARGGKSSSPRAERYRAGLWSARILAEQGKLVEASRIVDQLENSIPAREVLRKDRLNYYRGLFLLARALRIREESKKTRIKKEQEEKEAISAGFADKAIRAFSEARWAGPRGDFAVPAMLGAAEAHLITNNIFEANRLYRELGVHPLARPDQAQEAHLGLARTLQASKRYKKAARHIRDRLLTAKPEPEAGLLRRAIKLRADCLAAADEAEAASRAYARLAGKAADPVKAARAQIRRAAQMLKAGRHPEAARVLAGLAERCPRSLLAEIRFRTAAAYARAKQKHEALDYYVLSSRLPGEFQAPALVGAAECELEAANASRARDYARRALDLAPAGSLLAARAGLVRAEAFLKLGRFQDAVRQYRQAAEAARAQRLTEDGRKKELEAHRGLGEALGKLNRYEDAAASYLKAAYLLNPAKPDPAILELAAGALDASEEDKNRAAAAEIRRLSKRHERK